MLITPSFRSHILETMFHVLPIIFLEHFYCNFLCPFGFHRSLADVASRNASRGSTSGRNANVSAVGDRYSTRLVCEIEYGWKFRDQTEILARLVQWSNDDGMLQRLVEVLWPLPVG